jgi:hypothetical protein
MEIEIAVRGEGEAAPKAAAESGAERASGAEASAELSDSELSSLRDEVREKHARLSQISLYELLGVARSATPAQNKKAYIKAAKRLHPDALARLGLGELSASQRASPRSRRPTRHCWTRAAPELRRLPRRAQRGGRPAGVSRGALPQG